MRMPKVENIPYLIKLIDDESEFVRETCLKELRGFGDGLRAELKMLPEVLTEPQIETIVNLVDLSACPKNEVLFQIGELVRHRRYGYRGVVVDYDLTCQADEDWYRSNRTQPDRNQPWYHVVVSESSQGTYPAESSLMVDESKDEILNPLVSYFFSSFEKGVYIRNNRLWPLA